MNLFLQKIQRPCFVLCLKSYFIYYLFITMMNITTYPSLGWFLCELFIDLFNLSFRSEVKSWQITKEQKTHYIVTKTLRFAVSWISHKCYNTNIITDYTRVCVRACVRGSKLQCNYNKNLNFKLKFIIKKCKKLLRIGILCLF